MTFPPNVFTACLFHKLSSWFVDNGFSSILYVHLGLDELYKLGFLLLFFSFVLSLEARKRPFEQEKKKDQHTHTHTHAKEGRDVPNLELCVSHRTSGE
jgi:hypothetical protein